MNGSKVPSSRAISLGAVQISSLLDHYADLKNLRVKMCIGDLTDYTLHLGGNIMLTTSKGMPLIHIRRYWKPKEGQDLLPTKIGITLREEELANLLSVFPLYARRVKSELPHLKLVERCNELLEYCSKVPSIVQDDDHMTSLAPKLRLANGVVASSREKNEEEAMEEAFHDQEEMEDDAMSNISDSTLLLAESQLAESQPPPAPIDDYEEDSQLVNSPTSDGFPDVTCLPGKDINNNDVVTPSPSPDMQPPFASTPVARAPRKLLTMQASKRKFAKLSEQTSSPQQKKTNLRRALFPKK